MPTRAPPLSESVLAMVGWAITQEHYTFALGLLVAFYGLLRTGESVSYSILVNSYGFSISTCSHKPRHDQVRQKARSGWECYSHRTTCFDPFVGLETPRSSPRFPYFKASCLAYFVCWLHSETETPNGKLDHTHCDVAEPPTCLSNVDH